MIEFKRPDGQTSAGYAALAGAGRPAVVVIQEWWGLKPHILDLCERFAAAGYHALAPDLYRGRIAADADEAAHMMNGLDFVDACDQDLAGALGWLRAGGAGKTGVVGFCMGGVLAVAAAVRVPGVAAAVSFYGLPPTELADPAKLAIPLQGHFASEDAWWSPAVVDAFEARLTRPAELHRYTASHAFFNSSRPEVYDADCSKLAWQRTLDFLGRTL
ncbi:MAG: dienelactone hydrolase family protein [Pelomonas sp.]|nr:dienelactone hydrolase family protein [Roseateles sp.]